MYTLKELAAALMAPDLQNLPLAALLARFGVTSVKELNDLIGGPIQIRYKGLVCFGESSGFIEGGSADEPFALIAAIFRDGHRTERFPNPSAFYSDVDSGDSRNWPVGAVFEGRPVSVGIFIHLKDDKDDYTEHGARTKNEKYRVALDSAAQGVAFGAKRDGLRIPEDCEPLWQTYRILDAYRQADQTIGMEYMVIPVETLARMSERPLLSFKAIDYHFDSPLVSFGDASYKVYFDVVRI
jgi:hypothetical protein